MQVAENGRDVVTSASSGHQPSGTVLDRQEAVHQVVGDAVVQHIAAVELTGNESLDHRLRGILRRVTDDWSHSQLLQVEVAAATDSIHVFAQRLTTVNDYAQVT